MEDARQIADHAMRRSKHRGLHAFHPPCFNALRVDKTVRRRFTRTHTAMLTAPVDDSGQGYTP